MGIKGKKYIVYIHRNLINKKAYVGMTSYGKARWRKDGKGYKQNAQIWLDICEYGWRCGKRRSDGGKTLFKG